MYRPEPSDRCTDERTEDLPQEAPAFRSKLLTINAVLSVLRISRTTLWRHMKRGGIKSIRIGSRVLFEPAAVDEFIAYCRQRGYIVKAGTPPGGVEL